MPRYRVELFRSRRVDERAETVIEAPDLTAALDLADEIDETELEWDEDPQAADNFEINVSSWPE